ncbi:MAG: nitroreductase [Clostridia bacterium]|nr:nitroreductase [Clostridia bacterium]
MDLIQAMNERHSVRRYINKPLEPETAAALEKFIEECNAESGLHIQLVKNEPKAFDGAMARYGNFSGVTNYIAVIGKKGAGFEEKCGYYGEKIVLFAQTLGLNTCWVTLTFKKVPSAYKVNSGEKLEIVISVGYGESQGKERKTRTADEISNITAASPDWFKNGVEAALLAPTATNQQKFTLTLEGDKVKAKAGFSYYTKVDLGIVKYHFELGSCKDKSVWK